MKLIFYSFFYLFAAIHTSAFTYYVSTTGSNSNNGLSQASSFLTIQHAADLVNSGDSVIVISGSYAGFTVTTDGTISSRITFYAQPGVLINSPNATNDGINLEGASNITIEGFNVFGMGRAGLRAVLDTGVIFRNNKADSCFKWGILTGFSENILIEGNECSRTVDEHGIYFGNSSDHPTIRNNHCWGNNSCGIHMNGDVNLQPGDGIIKFALVENNIIHDNGNAGGSGINCDGVQNSIFRNNLLYNNHASGFSFYKIDGGGASINNLVVNNTVVQPSVTRWALNISDGSTGITAFNNILYSDHSFRGSISIDATSMIGFSSDYNMLTDRLSVDGGNTNITLSQWQTNTMLDSHSVISTPAQLFINAGMNDFHLSNSSPARNSGINSKNAQFAPINDIEGNLRPQGSFFDIGAYEYPEAVSIDEINNRSWRNLPGETEVFVYDLSGKFMFSTTLRDLKLGINEIHRIVICRTYWPEIRSFLFLDK